VDRSNIFTTAAGAVTLVVAAPVVLSATGILSLLWPVIPLLTVGSFWVAVNKSGNSNKSHDNNNNKPST